MPGPAAEGSGPARRAGGSEAAQPANADRENTPAGGGWQAARMGLWSWDRASGRVTWTDELFQVLGLSADSFQPSSEACLALVRPDQRARIAELATRALEEGASLDLDCPVVLPSGEQRWVRVVGTPLRLNGSVVGFHGAVHDLTKAMGRPPVRSALQDPVTGLAGRAILQNRAGIALARARRNATATALLVIDIDQFHEVNDEHGVQAGDELLCEVGRRLDALFRVQDTVGRLEAVVARLGADEFIVLCEDVDAQVVDVLGERVSDALSEPVQLSVGAIGVSASVGIALGHGGALDLEELFLRADAARRRARRRGRGQRGVFSDEARVQAGQPDEGALVRALEGGQFRLAYQPKVSLATDRMTGTEALLRWHHPERGVVPPLDFIPLAEETGIIVPIGAWVIEEACRQLAEWDRLAPQPQRLSVAVNVSARQFGADLVGVVSHALDTSGINPGMLCLEVTESVVMTDVDAAVVTLRALSDLGVRLSIDDFGTGYSSLAYLKKFPIHEVKIDKSFVDGLGGDPDDTAIVAAIVAVSHALDLSVVGEGVESVEQLERLRTLGCEYVQGYYYSPPVEPAAIARLVTPDPADDLADDGRFLPPAAAVQPDRVLIVDDASDVRMLARMSLSAAGFEVHEADGGASALASAKATVPDCILLDLLLPDMSGFEVCRALRAEPATAGCTIVMLTGNDDATDKVEAFASGVDDYMVKPFSPRDLTSRVHAAMRRRRDAETCPA